MYCLPELIIDLSNNNNGLTFHQINLLTSVQLSTDLEDRCNICLSEIKSGDSIRILNCKHNFHSECLDKWLHIKDTCPNCRTPISNVLEEGL